MLFFSGITNVFSSNEYGFSSQAISWADSVYNTLTLEERVSQLFIVDARDESTINKLNKAIYQPAFILGLPNISNRRWPKYISSIKPVLIPDLRSGFETGIPGLPFPDEKTLAFMETENQNNLLPHLYNWMEKNRYRALFASGNYIYNIRKSQSVGHSIVLPKPVSEVIHPNAYFLNVIEMPGPLVRSIPSFVLLDFPSFQRTNMISAPFFSPNKIQYKVSVEELLTEGNIFITTNYEVEFNRVLSAIKERWLYLESLEKTCKNILAFKFEAQKQNLNIQNTLSAKSFEVELRHGYESAIGVFQAKEKSPMPFIYLNLNIGYLSDGNGSFEEFRSMAGNYIDIDSNTTSIDQKEYNIIFWLVGSSFSFNIPIQERISEIKNRFPRASLIMVKAGDIAELPFYQLPLGLDGLIVSPANLPISWSAMAQAAFNGILVNKKGLNQAVPGPLSINSQSFFSTRLKYGIPEEVGLKSDTLALINKIVEDAIRKSAFPGAQVLVAKSGVVVFNQNYGWVDYDKSRPVTSDIIYDLASVTKIMATLPVLMHQYDNGRWRLSDKLSDFVPQAGFTDKHSITMRQLLMHESGLPAFISFYSEAIDTSKLEGKIFSWNRSSTHPIRVDNQLYMNKTVVYRDDIFRSQSDLDFSVPVAKNLFLNIFYRDSMLMRILRAKSNLVPKYRYSDLNFILLQKISENLAQESIDNIAFNQFYSPIGATLLCFNPWTIIPLERIAPTENDLAFRHQLIHGFVHDPTAAMMGGVAGHAGLFGNANNVSKLLQMYLNKGVYGGYRYLNEETVEFFSSKQDSINRRGLGFDKPDNNGNDLGSSSQLASPLSYGHTGFTGTMVWVDPEYDLVYVFLSNRVHPYQYNKKLMELGVRTKIQSLIYRSLGHDLTDSK